MGQTCQEIMTRNPACCEPGDTAEQVAVLMRNHNVGSVPVVASLASLELVGIVTDRDLTIKVLAEGRDPRDATVGEVMTARPTTCNPEDQISRALETMARHRVRRLPVVDHGKVIGIIAQADIATRLNAPADTAALVEEISREWKDM
jgi:CBS domain-containing protein